MFALQGVWDGLAYGFSTREDGDMDFSGGKDEVVNRRREFLSRAHPSFDIPRGVAMRPTPSSLLAMDPVSVVGVRESGWSMISPRGIVCEALVTETSDVFLFGLGADCPSIIIYEPERCILALVHAGRKSTVEGVPARVVWILKQWGADPRKLQVIIGPGIRKESYVLQTFAPLANTNSPWHDFCTAVPGGWMVDLFGYNRWHLFKAGVLPENLAECPWDTCMDRRFFSHCRSRDTGEPEGCHAVAVGMVRR